jgi:two-component system sensor histidine kinase PilS (NtrC family)
MAIPRRTESAGSSGSTRETSDVIALSAVLSADMAAEPGGSRARTEAEIESLRRRISYFMLFRLGLLAVFTLVATYTTWLVEERTIGLRDWLIWGALAAGYLLTLLFAWWLRPGRAVPHTLEQLRASSWAQSTFDVAFAVITILLSGAVESGFAFLFLIAVLGAATMGDRRQILVVAGVCGMAYFGVSMAQFVGLLDIFVAPGEVISIIDPTTLWWTLLRTIGAIGLVAILSSHLNMQLLSSVSQIGGLRALNENILRSLSSGLLTIDQNGKVLFANPTAASLLGYSGSIDGRDCEDLIPGVRAHLDDSGGFRNRFELTINHAKDNRRISLGLTCSPLLDEHGRFLGHIINYQDVTDLRDMERVLRRNERLAALGTLAASVAHEVRNPLAAIAGCAELLEPDVGEEDKRLIHVIRSESARLADIVTDLLDYARPRKLERHKIEFGRALTELADSFRADPSNANIDLRVNVPKQPVPVELDISQITQVLWNLVRNGSEAMDGTGRLDLDLEELDRELVRIRVHDRGKGIAPADIDRVFEPFFSTKSGGTGIGLALVHRIVDEHGGKIDVKSTLGEGTVFTIELPRRAPTVD